MSDDRDRGNEPQDSTRRNVALALFAGFGGALLKGCAQDTNNDPSGGDSDLRSRTDALSGTSFTWVDSINGPAPNLRSIVGSAAGAPCVAVGGYSTANDGGGGLFYWDASSSTGDDGGTIIVPTGSSTGRWQRMYDGPLNVKWFGAKGDGQTDDYHAIQTAIDVDCQHRYAITYSNPGAEIDRFAGGGEIFLPPGQYIVTQTIRLVDDGVDGLDPLPDKDAPRIRRRNITLSGAYDGASNGGQSNSAIVYQGPSDGVVLKLFSRDCIIRHLEFRISDNTTASVVIDVDGNLTPTEPGHTTPCTNNQFKNVHIFGSPSASGGGGFDYAVRFANQDKYNVEYSRFEKCYFSYARKACIQINSQDAKSHSFHACKFTGTNSASTYPSLTDAVAIECNAGSFKTYGCLFYFFVTAIRLGVATDHVLIQDTDSEGCSVFINDSGSTQDNYPVTVAGGRFNLQSLNPDGTYIYFQHGGPLTISGCNFDSSLGSVGLNFKLFVSNPGSGSLISIGNEFPNLNPYNLEDTSSHTCLVSLGNRGWAAHGVTQVLPNEFGSSWNETPATLALGGVRAISTGARAGNNLRGRIYAGAAQNNGLDAREVLLPEQQIADNGTVWEWTFAQPEPSDAYYLTLTCGYTAGVSSWGCTRVRRVERWANKFWIVLEEPVPAGGVVSFDWMLLR